MMRLSRATRNRRVAPVAFSGARATVPVSSQQPKPPAAIQLAHKRALMAHMIDHPEGSSTQELAGTIGLSAGRTYQLVQELELEGLVDSIGRGRSLRWVANV